MLDFIHETASSIWVVAGVAARITGFSLVTASVFGSIGETMNLPLGR